MVCSLCFVCVLGCGAGDRERDIKRRLSLTCANIFPLPFFFFILIIGFLSASCAALRTELQRNGDLIISTKILQRVCQLQNLTLSLFSHELQSLVGPQLKSSEISQVKLILIYFSQHPGTK